MVGVVKKDVELVLEKADWGVVSCDWLDEEVA